MNRAKLNRQRGKRAQKRFEDILCGFNVGTLGKFDILTENFIIEVKDLARFVGDTFLKQAEKHLSDKRFKNKKATAIVHIRGTRYENSIVMLRLKDFLELLNWTSLNSSNRTR